MRDAVIQEPGAESADEDDRTLTPGQWAAALSDAVAKDLDTVFAHPSDPGREIGWIAQAEAVRSVRPSPKRRWRWPSLVLGGTLTILGAGGGLAGGYYLWAYSARPIQQPIYALQVSEAPHPVAAPPARSTRPSAPQPLPAAPTSPVASAPVLVTPPVPNVLTAHKAPLPDPATPRQAKTDRDVKNLIADCDRGAGCTAASVARADRLVGDAYASALQSGARPADLADVQRRWTDLRHETDEPPQILVGNYALLAKELSRMTAAPVQPRHPGAGAAR